MDNGAVLEMIREFILGDALILIPALYIIGFILKNTETVCDKYIPVILLVLGIVLAILVMGLNADAVIQGILVTGAAVLINIIPKQLKYH